MNPEPEYVAWIRKDEAILRFFDHSALKGPFKFYVPNREAPEHVVNPEQVYQRWTGKFVEATFPLSAVGLLRDFDFVAVTVTNDGTQIVEWDLLTGHCPSP